MAKFPAAFEDSTGKIQRLTGELDYLPDPAATPGDVLTVQADGSVAASPGGGSAPQVSTVRVNSAEILALFDTPVTLVAGVAGKVPVVNGYSITYVAGSTPYTVDPDGELEIVTAGNMWVGVSDVGFLDQAASQVSASGYVGGDLVGPLSAVDGEGISLTNTVANPTLGDGTLVVTISYFLAPAA